MRFEVEDYCGHYMKFLTVPRTDREAVHPAVSEAREDGFTEYKRGMYLEPGSKIFSNNRAKSLILAVIGEKALGQGCVITGVHVDSPRLDLKQIPLYVSDERAFFKTHYYGGIKKYQWMTIPLELHGTVALKDGSIVEIVIGRKADDPKFVIADLLPHLAVLPFHSRTSAVRDAQRRRRGKGAGLSSLPGFRSP